MSSISMNPSSEMVMPAPDFCLSRFERGHKHSIVLSLPGLPEISLPVLLVRGSRPGRMLVVTAGVHGDEFEGIRAILDMYSELDPETMSGAMIAVPVANPPAFWVGTRLSPLDDKNLARAFPGRPQGSATEVIAFHLAHSVIARADFYVDLHSAGVKLLMPTMVGYDANDPRSQAAALIFGAAVIWGHPSVEPGRTISFATSRGIPCLYTEARGAGRIHDDDLRIFTNGIRNLLRHLAILPGGVVPAPIERRLLGDGDLDASLLAKKPGFLKPKVNLLERVRAGQELGITVNLSGAPVETFKASADGTVAMIHAFPMVKPGDTLFLLAGEEEE